MHQIVFLVAMFWLLLLVAALLAYALRARTTMDRILALDTLVLVFVASFSIVGIQYQQPGMLDVALVLAMLGFVQTVTAARLAERREDLR